jgi:phosphate/sulfate permease
MGSVMMKLQILLMLMISQQQHHFKGVKWNTAQRMIITWVITLPISALLAALIFWVMNNPEYQCC